MKVISKYLIYYCLLGIFRYPIKKSLLAHQDLDHYKDSTNSVCVNLKRKQVTLKTVSN